MHLESIELTNFKSYIRRHFDFSPELNVIFGANGSGKTNLLDAIHVLAMTKSNFTTSDQQLIRNSAEFYRLEGSIKKSESLVQVVLKLPKGKKKTIERDLVPVRRPADHVGFIPVVMITPDDLNLINASNSERRKLADSTLSQVDRNYLENLVIYNRLLKQRNVLLKQGQETGKLDTALLETYTSKMEKPAQIVFERRSHFFNLLEKQLQEYYRILSGGEESVKLVYKSQLSKSSMIRLASDCFNRDRATGRTNQGVHRDAIECFIEEKDARIFASQGQKKSLVFAIKLAQLDFMKQSLSDKPILLLDDIFDRLDMSRVNSLLSIILSDTFGQIFITDTQWERIRDIISNYDVSVHKIEIEKNPLNG